jgi:NDP-sugar pyrophosphorylase family protein
VDLHYSHEERILGTAGAIRQLAPYLAGRFVVVYGDVLTDLNLTELLAFHDERRDRLGSAGPLVTMSLYRVNNPTECGIVEIGADARIRRVVEKPKPAEVFSDLASSGVLVMEPEVRDFITGDRFADIAYHLIPALLDAGRSVCGKVMTADEYLIDIGTPVNYRRAQREWAGRNSGS